MICNNLIFLTFYYLKKKREEIAINLSKAFYNLPNKINNVKELIMQLSLFCTSDIQ